jgi:hypothetical protein
VWGMLDVNPAKVGVDNPTPRRKEQHPFDTWRSSRGRKLELSVCRDQALGLEPGEKLACRVAVGRERPPRGRP